MARFSENLLHHILSYSLKTPFSVNDRQVSTCLSIMKAVLFSNDYICQ